MYRRALGFIVSANILLGCVARSDYDGLQAELGAAREALEGLDVEKASVEEALASERALIERLLAEQGVLREEIRTLQIELEGSRATGDRHVEELATATGRLDRRAP